MVRSLALALAGLAGLVASCGETTIVGFGFDAGGPPLSVSYVVEGGAAGEFLSFHQRIEDVRLLTQEDMAGGARGIGALPEPVTVELLGLEHRARLLTTRYYGPGDYTHLRVELGPAPPLVLRRDGTPVVWTPAAWAQGSVHEVTLELREPLQAVHGAALDRTLVIAMDPSESQLLDGLLGQPNLDAESGPMEYAYSPVIRVRELDVGERLAADDYWGALVSGSEPGAELRIQSDAHQTVAERGVTASVRVDGATLMLASSGTPVVGWSGLPPAQELAGADVWIRGKFEQGAAGHLVQIRADSLQLDHLRATGSTDAAVVCEAVTVGRDGPDLFRICPVEWDRGAAVAQAVLMGAGHPSAIQVRIDTAALVLNEAAELGTRDDLAIGTRVKWHFAAFAQEPFNATRVSVVTAAEHPCVLLAAPVDLGPARVSLLPGAPAIEGGHVAGIGTTVTVGLGSLLAALDVEGQPLLAAATLPPGLHVSVSGTVAGTPSTPTIMAASLTIRPGRFRGAVSSTTPAASGSSDSGSFAATVDAIDAPFGGETPAPPFTVEVAHDCFFEGAASTWTEFRTLHAGLTPGETLAVTVSGVGATTPNTVMAYQVHAAIR